MIFTLPRLQFRYRTKYEAIKDKQNIVLALQAARRGDGDSYEAGRDLQRQKPDRSEQGRRGQGMTDCGGTSKLPGLPPNLSDSSAVPSPPSRQSPSGPQLQRMWDRSPFAAPPVPAPWPRGIHTLVCRGRRLNPHPGQRKHALGLTCHPGPNPGGSPRGDDRVARELPRSASRVPRCLISSGVITTRHRD